MKADQSRLEDGRLSTERRLEDRVWRERGGRGGAGERRERIQEICGKSIIPTSSERFRTVIDSRPIILCKTMVGKYPIKEKGWKSTFVGRLPPNVMPSNSTIVGQTDRWY